MATLTAAVRLVQAEDALHKLLTGRSTVECRDSNGASIVYSRTNIGSLRAYIEQLKAEIAGSTPCVGPLSPYF